MTTLGVVALALVLLALLFVILPLLPSSAAAQGAVARDSANVAMFEERLAELETERELGLYSDSEFDQLKQALTRHLLEDTNATQEGPRGRIGLPLPVTVSIILFLPLMAWYLYDSLGAAGDLALAEDIEAFQQVQSQQEALKQLALLAPKLEQRLTERPGNSHYLMLLAQARMELREYPAAVEAYRRLMGLAGEDPTVMGRYAQALYLAEGRKLTEQVRSLADRTLELQPFNTTVLGMMGMASFERADFAGAVDYWQRLLRVLNPQSPNAQMIQRGIEQARAQMVATGQQPAAGETAAPAVAINVAVRLSGHLNAPADASVFVFARAINGPKMPLAVARFPVSELPKSVVLNDAMAMMPSLKLSNFEQVEIVARVSSQGIANPSPGDLEGQAGPVATQDSGEIVELLIDSTRG